MQKQTRIQWSPAELSAIKQHMEQLPDTIELIERVNLAQSAVLPTERIRIIDTWSQAQRVVQRINSVCKTEQPAQVVETDKVIVLELTPAELLRLAPHLKQGTKVVVV